MTTEGLQPQNILQDIRVQLLNIGEHAFVDMMIMMKEFGKADKISKIELMNALTKSGVFLSLVQLSMIVRAFDLDGSGQLDVDSFSKALMGEYSERRLRLLDMVFNKIDKNGNKKIEFKEMMEQFKPENHPSVRSSLLTADVVMDRMRVVFEGAEKKGYLSFEDFKMYYSRMNATIPNNDDLFCEIVASTWGVREKEEKKGMSKDDPKITTMLEILKEKVRQKSNTHLGNINTTLYKLFKFFDKGKKETVTVTEWMQVLNRLGVTVGKDIAMDVYYVFAENNELEYKEFVEWLFSNPNKSTKHRFLS